MQILFNELSLAGQFSNPDAFIEEGLIPFVLVLKEMQGFSTLMLKKSDVWNHKITPSCTLHAFLIGKDYRKSDAVRRLKSSIANLTKEPFWDSDSRQDPLCSYFLGTTDIRNSSVAEACERDKIIVSFLSSPTSLNPLDIMRSNVTVSLTHLTQKGRLAEFLWNSRQISFEVYLKSYFSGSKLDFSEMDQKFGFSTIEPSEENIFNNAFKKFTALNWNEIYEDKGLDYKEYQNTINQNYRHMKTYKFRVSQKFRCHGFRKNDLFMVIGFETDHKRSDRG